jgi:nucleotidyltransferase/DNA polymerase involved in DNA repair
MPWCHRVVREVEKWHNEEVENYSIREFFFDLPDEEQVHGEKGAYTEDEIAPVGATLDDLEWALTEMLKAVKAAKEDPELVIDDATYFEDTEDGS